MVLVVELAKNGRQQVHSPSASLRVGMTSQKSKGKDKNESTLQTA
jgi:hypothetical protein